MRIYVVEGIHDEAKLKLIDSTIVAYRTNGTGVSKELLDELLRLSQMHEIVLLLDPDGPGNKIRTIIQDAVPNCKHIYFDQIYSRSKNKKKIGVEHIDVDTLRDLLQHPMEILPDSGSVNEMDLYDLGLVGTENANDKRQFVCSVLKLGTGNANAFLKKCNLHGVTVNQIKEALTRYVKQ